VAARAKLIVLNIDWITEVKSIMIDVCQNERKTRTIKLPHWEPKFCISHL